MNKKVLAGIAAGLLTTAVLVLVGAGAYRAGQRSDATIEVVGGTEGGSEIARTLVVAGDGWRDGWHGPGPGIVIFPLIVIGLILLFASRRGPGHGPGSWHRGWDGRLDDWHRQAHAAAVPTDQAPPPGT